MGTFLFFMFVNITTVQGAGFPWDNPAPAVSVTGQDVAKVLGQRLQKAGFQRTKSAQGITYVRQDGSSGGWSVYSTHPSGESPESYQKRCYLFQTFTGRCTVQVTVAENTGSFAVEVFDNGWRGRQNHAFLQVSGKESIKLRKGKVKILDDGESELYYVDRNNRFGTLLNIQFNDRGRLILSAASAPDYNGAVDFTCNF